MSAAAKESPAAPVLRYLMQPLQAWLDDPATEELCINKPGEIWVRQRGVFERHDMPLDLGTLEHIAVLAASLRHQDVGERNPLCSTELPGGERLQICIPPVVPRGTISLTIRKHSETIDPLAGIAGRYRVEGWNRWKPKKQRRDHQPLLDLFDAGDIDAFLLASVEARLNILACGATGSGKTRFNKMLIGAIDPSYRVITIEDAMELMIRQANHVRLLYSKGDQGVASITAEDLIEAAMRMRPDVLILGEMRDAAAWSYLMEVLSGHKGSISSIHGSNPVQAVKRFFALVKGSAKGSQWDDKTLVDMMEDAVDLIVPFNNEGATYSIGEVWFAADAARRGETVADLLRE